MKKILLSILLLTCLGSSLFGQKKLIDSIKNVLKSNDVLDTNRVVMTHILSYRLSEINPAESWSYATETEKSAQKLNFKKGLCLANINFAILESNEGNFKKSADYYLRAINYADSIGYTRGLSISYNNIGDNYLKLKEYNKVLEYSNKALELNKSINEHRGQAINLEQIGQVHFLQGNIEKAKQIWDKGIELAKKTTDVSIYNQLLLDLGKYYSEKNIQEKAYSYLYQADSAAKTLSNDHYLRILTSKALASYFDKLNKGTERGNALQVALEKSIVIGNKSEECDIYNLLSQHYEKEHKIDSAMFFLRKHKTASDSILNEKNYAHIAYVQTQYETQLKEKENQELKQIQKKQDKKLSEKNLLLIASGLALLLAFISIVLLRRYYLKSKKNIELEEQQKISEYKHQVADLELRSLRSQMNPHFLFNSLNSIRNYIIKNEPQKASKYLASFATLMRKILDSSQQEFIQLEEELEMLKIYLELEQLRFSNKFSFEINVDSSLEPDNTYIPPMILQPFIENAIWHGLLPLETEDGKLTLNFIPNKTSNHEIICEITDNGIGRAKSEQMGAHKKHKSKGISITKDRLNRLSYENTQQEHIFFEDLYNEKNEAAGTKVIVHLPLG